MDFLKLIILLSLIMGLALVSSLITFVVINKTQNKTEGMRNKESEIKLRLSFVINKYFLVDDLKVLYDEMGIDYDRVASSGDVKKIMALINYCHEVGRVSELIELVEELRPAIVDELWLLKGDVNDALVGGNRLTKVKFLLFAGFYTVLYLSLYFTWLG